MQVNYRTGTLLLFFASGFTGLVYEVLWMKELALLFGNTAYAAATTLASFFLGLAAGSYVWGRHAARAVHPLRTYAILEAAVAGSALLYFYLLDAYHTIYSPLFEIFGHYPAVFVAIKFLLAVGALFPPAFFMGGTLPVLSQFLVGRSAALGTTGAALYGINTLGATLGAFAAGFLLPPWLGFRNSYAVALVLTLLVAAGAWGLAAVSPPHAGDHRPEPGFTPDPAAAQQGAGTIKLLAFLSGFVALSLEVLWTRMFAQVLQNSVYTFSVILVTFLLSLALGSALASALARRHRDAPRILLILLAASSLLVVLTPFLFTWLMNGLEYVGGETDWTGYVLRVFGYAALVMLPAGVCLGSVFPFLMKISEPLARGAGRTVGGLLAANTTGAIAGSLAAGFVLLEQFGMWHSIQLMALVYACAALWVAWALLPSRSGYRLASASGLVLLVLLLGASRFPLVTGGSEQADEHVFEVWEGSAATVAVVEQRRPYQEWAGEAADQPRTRIRSSLRIKVNNYYNLGGTESSQWEQWQSHLPLLLHPKPRTVFFLGMGTGITAGAALGHPVDRVVVSEILPEAVEASREYFSSYVNGLFEDPRARVVIEDGRNFLLGTREHYDVAVADLFMPWKAGTASLYTLEHYQAARARLRDGGLFAQWLPLHQMSRTEFSIIARTMIEVFPLVTVWRGDFFSKAPVVVLIGHQAATPFDPRAIGARLGELASPELGEIPLRDFVPDAAALPADPARFLLYYCGNLTAARQLVAAYPLNTDDRPVIEYGAPITQRRELARQASWFIGPELIDFFERLLATVPLVDDPYLQALTESQRAFVRAGLDLHKLQVLEIIGDHAGAQRALRQFIDVVFAL